MLNAYSQGISGGDKRFIEIAKRWKSIELTVATSRNGSILCKRFGLKGNFLITSGEKTFQLIPLLYVLRTFIAIVKMRRVNAILYSTSDFFPDVVPPFIVKSNAARWFCVIHHLYPHYTQREGNPLVNFAAYYLQKISFYLIKKRADGIIVVNETVKHALLHDGFPEKKIFVSANGVNIDAIRKSKKEGKAYDGIFMGRVTISKGIFDLLRIWHKICQYAPHMQLAIIGEGSRSITKEMLHMIQRYNLSNNVTMLGFVPDKTVYTLMKSGRVFLFPSHEEGFGIAIIEALACDLPVVAYDLLSYPKMIRKYIHAVKPYNLDDFSKTCLELMTKKTATEHTKKSIALHHGFSWDTIAKRELDFISN